jgi:CopG family nickel-responsive transcriptional regulator
MSLDSELLERFDKLIEEQGYNNRSEAIRDLIRNKLISESWKDSNEQTMGVFSIVYDHHHSNLSQELTEIQHNYVDIIVSSTHIHVDHDNCMEVVILKGHSDKILAISHALQSIKGVKHGKLIMTTTGMNIK